MFQSNRPRQYVLEQREIIAKTSIRVISYVSLNCLLCLVLIGLAIGPESVLPDVLAIHTVEMIPKSMT